MKEDPDDERNANTEHLSGVNSLPLFSTYCHRAYFKSFTQSLFTDLCKPTSRSPTSTYSRRSTSVGQIISDNHDILRQTITESEQITDRRSQHSTHQFPPSSTSPSSGFTSDPTPIATSPETTTSPPDPYPPLDFKKLDIVFHIKAFVLYLIFQIPFIPFVVLLQVPIAFCLYQASYLWLPPVKSYHRAIKSFLRELSPPSNVTFSISQSSMQAKIEIGGSQHFGDDWKVHLESSRFIKWLKVENVMCFDRNFKADIIVHRNRDVKAASAATKEFYSVMNMFLLKPRLQYMPRVQSTPSLELNVTVVRDSSVDDSVADDLKLDIPSLVNLHKLTWRGSRPDFLLGSSATARNGSEDEDQPRKIMFPRLKELSLIDCELSSKDLVQVVDQCPYLTSLEVYQLPPDHPSKYASRQNMKISFSTPPTTTITGTSPRSYPYPYSSSSFSSTPTSSSSSSSSKTLIHSDIQRLRIESALDLDPFFSALSLPICRSLSIHISRWTPMSINGVRKSVHDYVSLLPIPWSTVTHCDFRAPFEWYAFTYLRGFFEKEPAVYGRTQTLIMDKQS